MRYLKEVFFIFLISCSLKAQELPSIQIFTPEIYGGENQNWMISQASNKFIYIANNEGLLEYNGATWKIYSSPNNTIIRAVKVVDNKIYTGSYMEFGYWEKDSFGMLNYNSLVPKLNEKMIEDENIWNIITYQEWIIFQSFNRIYFYNPAKGKFTIINSKNSISKVFNNNNEIYYFVNNEGLFKIKEGKSKLIVNNSILDVNILINVFSINEGLLIQTRNSGFYIFKVGKLQKWKGSELNELDGIKIYNSIQLKDKSFVLGTISNGIIFLSKEGKIQYQLNQKNGLSNNTALSLFEDSDENIWVGLDNGINCINIKSPVNVFNDDDGFLGTVYTSLVFNNYIYLGTNQGLFCKKIDSNETFKIIAGTAGQVWDLFENDKELFCGHHLGTFLIDENKAIKISDISGTWSFRKIPGSKNRLLQGNYSGFYVLINKNGKWVLENKIVGFDNSARYFEFINSNELFVSHGYKGVFKLNIDKSFEKFTKISKQNDVSIGKNSSLIKFNNSIFYANNKGIYKYDLTTDKFLIDTILSPIIKNETFLSGKLIVDKSQKLWGFSKESINYATINDLTKEFNIHTIDIPASLRKGISGYENISLYKDNKYLLGTSNGYITLDLENFETRKESLIFINEISTKNRESNKSFVNLKDNGEFSFDQNSIVFKFSVPVFDKYQSVIYQYKLEGYYNKWSDWSNQTILTFDNLPFGDYTFNVRGKLGNELTNNIATYHFQILKPWYFSYFAIFIYCLVFFICTFLLHKAHLRHYKNQLAHKQLESEQLIIRMKNEKLNQDIENKNRELAISTMSIINKNEVLNSIKNELKTSNINSNNLQVLKLIDGNLNNSKDWDVFREAFNNADKYFLDKIKELHPNLTPNDLRFCAYLRLNLTSKEISPLLNMTVRSVETKRYRLRKQMGLPHDTCLVSYILNI